MTDLASRFANNPIVRPSDVKPSVPGWEVACAFNPGAFSFQGRIGLVLRVAERPPQREGEVDSISFSDGKLKVDTFKVSDLLFQFNRLSSWNGSLLTFYSSVHLPLTLLAESYDMLDALLGITIFLPPHGQSS